MYPFRETSEHRANFIELSSDIIDGELEWEVEHIIGTQLYGWKKEQQYQVHWKGYSATHDTWKPTSNVRAPELIQQFLQLSLDAIRAVWFGPKDIRMNPESFREWLLEEPERHPLATLSSHPKTLKSTPNYTTALAKAYADRVIPGVIAQLEICPTNPTPHIAAQHNDQKKQERQEGRKRKKTFTTATFLGEKRVQNHPSIAKHLSRGALPTEKPAHRNRKPDPRVTKEALVSTVLLNNLNLEDIDGLRYPIYHMGTDSDNPPDPPWFSRPDMPFILRLVALNENKDPIDLPYLQYTLADDEPVLLRTQGHDQTIHYAELVAMPALPPPFPSSVQDSDLELLYLDHPFN